MSEAWVEQVLSFWFDELDRKARFAKDDAVDAMIMARFGAVYDALRQGLDTDAATASAERALASVIVLDQFPRNMFRGSPRAFESDPLALRLARAIVDKGLDTTMPPERRAFVYLPFEHSEELEVQSRSVELFATLGDAEFDKYAEAHRIIIERFGRFPHRNEVLGRPSTPEEIAFLKEPNSSF